MPSSYQPQHAAALAQLRARGAAVTFTQFTGGSYDVTTGAVGAGVVTTISGSAMRVRGNPLRYQALSLLEAEAPTLFFVPDVYGQLPSLDAQIVWGGDTYNVREITPVAPDGVALAAKIVVAR